MSASIHEAVWDWLSKCSFVTKLYFNFGEASDESTIIMTSGDTVLEEYIDGSQRRRYAFDLVRILPVGWSPNDPGNVDMMEDAEEIAGWMEDQSDEGHFPEFPENCAVERVAVSDEGAGYADMQDENRARYVVPIMIDYILIKE